MRFVNENVFLLFADCIPVKGAKRSIICDVGRERIITIPNSLHDFILAYEGKPLKPIESLDLESQSIIDDYLDHLESNELIFWCSESEVSLFPKLIPKWSYPATISNAIIEFNPEIDYKPALKELNKLGCSYFLIKLHHLSKLSYNSLNVLLSDLIENCSNLNGIELSAPYDLSYMGRLIQTVHNTPFISHLTLFDAPDVIYKQKSGLFKENVFLSTEKFQDDPNSSRVSTANFLPNIDFFFESKKHNPYFNKKITIDYSGNVKNAPHMKNSFGNILHDQIGPIVGNKHFRSLWHISKDRIKVCMDCEFRYVCMDTRAIYHDNIEGIHYAMGNCNYDPYLAEWKNVNTN